MDCTATKLPYQDTGYFSKLITDYLGSAPALRAFYAHPPNLDGIKAAIRDRESFPTNRELLVAELEKQYQSLPPAEAVRQNLESLKDARCFTVTTAHQPAIFTGTLYFIYKILHTIQLARELERQLPGYRFVPVFYMGSEDADLDELGHIYLDRQEIIWDTRQTGAVGRMKPKGLETLIERIAGEYGVQPFGPELIQLFRESYLKSENIQTATLRLLHALFGEYGLIVLIADNAAMKRTMIPVFEAELFNRQSASILAQPLEKLAKHYKVQAQPRDINLFYLKEDIRGRIDEEDGEFIVHETNLRFSKTEMREELEQFPERFSPNVILRGLYQETLLPNIVFLGGGGELAYWMELKALFEYNGVPYPLLLLRNSFLVIEEKWRSKISRAGLSPADLFQSTDTLINRLVKNESANRLDLTDEIAHAKAFYSQLKTLSGQVDPSLVQHVEALETRALKPIQALEKKLLKAEKRKFSEQQKQIAAIRQSLFPFNNLQERVDTLIPYYARFGRAFLELILAHSAGLDQQFTILELKE